MFNLMTLKSRTLMLALSCMVLSFYSYAGQADKKHEERKHISSTGNLAPVLSLDDVLPGSKSLFIAPSSDKEESILEPILIRVTGYSAFESEQDAKSEPKRLLALRASKLDAYRELAERVYGLSISSQSLVNGFVMKEDRFAVEMDSFVRGARVVSISEREGLGFETVLELILPGNFNDCINKVNQFKNGLNCLRPLPKASYLLDQVKSSEKAQANSERSMRQGSGYFLK